MYRHIFKGSWTFSDQDQGLQLSDCTTEALKVTNFVTNSPLLYSAACFSQWCHQIVVFNGVVKVVS